ncbi:MAG: hypothetical protein ABL997_06650 [Planctomycetota bacterium]
MTKENLEACSVLAGARQYSQAAQWLRNHLNNSAPSDPAEEAEAIIALVSLHIMAGEIPQCNSLILGMARSGANKTAERSAALSLAAFYALYYTDGSNAALEKSLDEADLLSQQLNGLFAAGVHSARARLSEARLAYMDATKMLQRAWVAYGSIGGLCQPELATSLLTNFVRSNVPLSESDVGDWLGSFSGSRSCCGLMTMIAALLGDCLLHRPIESQRAFDLVALVEPGAPLSSFGAAEAVMHSVRSDLMEAQDGLRCMLDLDTRLERTRGPAIVEYHYLRARFAAERALLEGQLNRVAHALDKASLGALDERRPSVGTRWLECSRVLDGRFGGHARSEESSVWQDAVQKLARSV